MILIVFSCTEFTFSEWELLYRIMTFITNNFFSWISKTTTRLELEPHSSLQYLRCEIVWCEIKMMMLRGVTCDNKTDWAALHTGLNGVSFESDWVRLGDIRLILWKWRKNPNLARMQCCRPLLAHSAAALSQDCAINMTMPQ